MLDSTTKRMYNNNMTAQIIEQEIEQLTPEQIERLRPEVLDKIVVARVGLLLRHPFFGNMATRLIIKECDDWCPTAATDGKYFYYNRNFVDALSNDELVFLWGHEVEHCVYDHFGRRGDKQPLLWNIANDYVVNMDLVEGNVGKKISLVDICFDYKYQRWTSEEVYEDLYKQAEEEGRIFDMSTLVRNIHWRHIRGKPIHQANAPHLVNTEFFNSHGGANYCRLVRDFSVKDTLLSPNLL